MYLLGIWRTWCTASLLIVLGTYLEQKWREASEVRFRGEVREKTAKWPFSESKNAVTLADAFAFVFFIYSPRHDERIAF